MNEEKIQPKKPDEIYCPSCAKPVNKDAVMCPHCKVQLKEFKVSEEFKVKSPVKKIELERKKPGRPKKVLRTIIIIFSIIIILGAAIGLYWYRGERLVVTALDADYGGRPVEALALYEKIAKQYPYPFWFIGSFSQWVPYKVEFLKDYQNAYNLEESGKIPEAIAAYESFIKNKSGGYILYDCFSRIALVDLKLELAEDLHSKMNYEEAIKVYQSFNEMKSLEETGFKVEEPIDQWEKAVLEVTDSIEGARLKAENLVPGIYLEWVNSLKNNKAYEEAINKLKLILSGYPAVVKDLKIEDKIAEIYYEWANQLRNNEKYNEAIDKYRIILNQYSKATIAQEIELALAETQNEFKTWKEETEAILVIDYNSELTRNDEDKWIIVTTFKETGGKIGYTLKGEGWIVDIEGREFGPYGSICNRGEVIVSPGGEAGAEDYWFGGDIFIDGYAIFTWTGEDENGHAIEIEEKIHLLP